MKKISIFLIAALTLGLLAACTGPVIIAGTAGTAYLTKPSGPGPADTADQIPPHESWCYSTLGDSVECYSQPQDVPYGRLVMVDPASRYPLTAQDYSDELAQSRAAQAARQAAKIPPPPAVDASVGSVQPAEMTPIPPPAVKATPVPKHTASTKAKKKKHKKKKPACGTKPATPATPAAPPVPLTPPPAISN